MKPPAIPTGRNPWCGPYAIAVACGLTTDQAERLLLRERRKTLRQYLVQYPRRADRACATRANAFYQRVVGTPQPELLRAVALRRVFLRSELPDGRPTLAAWLAREGTRHGDAVAIVRVRGHYLVCWRGLVSDNNTRAWMDGSAWKHRSARVLQVTFCQPRRVRRRPARAAEPQGAAPGQAGAPDGAIGAPAGR